MHTELFESRVLAIVVFGFSVACGTSRPSSCPPSTAVAPTSGPEKSVGTLTPEERAVLAEMLASSPSTDRLPTSRWTIDGESVSDVTAPKIVESLRQAGWAEDGSVRRDDLDEHLEGLSIAITKGADQGRFRIVRPAAKHKVQADGGVALGHLPDAADKDTTAYVFDGDSQVYVEVEIKGRATVNAAKALLESIVRKNRSESSKRALSRRRRRRSLPASHTS